MFDLLHLETLSRCGRTAYVHHILIKYANSHPEKHNTSALHKALVYDSLRSRTNLEPHSATHSTVTMAITSWFFFLWLFGDDAFRGEQERRDTRCILER